MTIRSVFI